MHESCETCRYMRHRENTDFLFCHFHSPVIVVNDDDTARWPAMDKEDIQNGCGEHRSTLVQHDGTPNITAPPLIHGEGAELTPLRKGGASC